MEKHRLGFLFTFLLLPAALSAVEFSFDFRPATDKAALAEVRGNTRTIANEEGLVSSHLARSDSVNAAAEADFAVGDQISVRLFS